MAGKGVGGKGKGSGSGSVTTTTVVGFDVSIPINDENDDHNVVGMKLAEVFKKFAFQKERTAAGYVHYQCRGWTWKRMAIQTFIAEFCPYLQGHASITSNGTHAGPRAFNYVMKLDTRVDGP